MLLNGEEIRVVDADTHVLEPPDLWTNHMPKEFLDRAPVIRWDEKADQEMWFLGDRAIFPALKAAHYGWHEYAPGAPKRWAEANVAAWDVKERLARMDEYGVYAQVLYPNVAMFGADRQSTEADREFQTVLNRAYNDWQAEWTSAAPDRLLPMISLPFWDLEESLREVQRCGEMGFRGLIFSQKPEAFGLPPITSRHWDPLWALAQEMSLPVNFHIGSGDFSFEFLYSEAEIGERAAYAARSVSYFMTNAQTITNLILGGVCHRFPKLNFVSVESGAGYIPFLLEAIDWQFLNSGGHQEHPEFELKPSEYFMRQIYACFWFERGSVLDAIRRVGARNFLFETDFPHGTGQSPGPASHGVPASQYIEEVLGSLPIEDAKLILRDNAARLYNLQLS